MQHPGYLREHCRVLNPDPATVLVGILKEDLPPTQHVLDPLGVTNWITLTLALSAMPLKLVCKTPNRINPRFCDPGRNWKAVHECGRRDKTS